MNVKIFRSGVLLSVVGVFFFLLFITYSSGKKHPIAFNHKKHVENNVGCIVCHRFYEDHAQAGIPDVDVCMRCHEDVVYVSSEKEKLLSYSSSRKKIPWLQVYSVPDHVLFSHRRHVIAGELECEKCHGDVAGMIEPITIRVRNLSMDDCITCHSEVYKNPNECISCHR